jgi:preprotein translocase subunit Sec63
MKEDFYARYCIHNNPIYYDCPACKYNRQQRIYNDYLNIRVQKDITDKNDMFSSLKRSDSQEDLKKEYYKLAKKHHPDKNGNEETFKRLQNLYEKLKQKFNI